MNKVIIYTVLSLLTAAVLYLFYTQFFDPKLVYVDANKLVNGYAGMAEAQAAFKEKSTVWQTRPTWILYKTTGIRPWKTTGT